METIRFIDYFHTVKSWAEIHPNRTALRYLTEGSLDGEANEWSYQDLIVYSCAVAAHLRKTLNVGDRALLLYPPGLPFVAAFLGCLASGTIAVPAPLPDGRDKAQDRLAGIVADSGAQVVLTESSIAPLVAAWANTLPAPVTTCATDTIATNGSPDFVPTQVAPSDPAFLQYTSGSTSCPKGVIVTHRNLVHNEIEIKSAINSDDGLSVVGWLPQFHDMGLIGMVLHPLFVGGVSSFLSPLTFIKHPIQWLRAMSAYRSTMSVAPNFAFDLVVRRCTPDELAGIDLSSVGSILNGSEPIQGDSITRFSTLLAPYGLAPNAVMPVYGLAEATLFVTGTSPATPMTCVTVEADALAGNRLVVVADGTPHSRVLVASGHSQSLEIAVMDKIGSRLADGEIGEVWVRGDSVAAGYWNMPEQSAATFNATSTSGANGWLRTGDLGAMVDGDLFITGRIKECVVLNGRNLYAHDIEAAARAAVPALTYGVGAAFAVGNPERLVLIHEVRPEHLGNLTLEEVATTVRSAIFNEFSTSLADLVLLPRGGVARTTSGKVRRNYMREMYETGQLSAISAVPVAESSNTPVKKEIR